MKRTQKKIAILILAISIIGGFFWVLACFPKIGLILLASIFILFCIWCLWHAIDEFI